MTGFDFDYWVSILSSEQIIWAIFALLVSVSAFRAKESDRVYVAIGIYSFFEFLLAASYAVYFFQPATSPYGGFIVFCRVIIFAIRALAMGWLINALLRVKNGH